MTAGGCAVMVRASIKASALPLMQANAVRSIRWSCWRTGLTQKAGIVSLSRARDAMHVYTRDKAALRQSVMYPGERKSVWELIQALRRSEPQSRNRMMPDLWATRQAEIFREMGMER